MATWNLTFEQQPVQLDTPTEGDDEIRSLKGAIEERMANEHTTYVADSTTGTVAKDWLHKAGSAAAFYAATVSAPATRLSGEALIDGMLWYDTTLNVIKVRSSSSWVTPAVNLPIGAVMFFSGTWTDNVTIPGWYKCNGSNGTIDLITDNRFIRCASTSGGSGGNTGNIIVANNLPTHTHAVGTLANAAAVDHSHSISISGTTGSTGAADYSLNNLYNASDSTAGQATYTSHTHTFSWSGSSSSAGAHGHAISGATGNNTTTATAFLPLYYDLIPIMRVS